MAKTKWKNNNVLKEKSVDIPEELYAHLVAYAVFQKQYIINFLESI